MMNKEWKNGIKLQLPNCKHDNKYGFRVAHYLTNNSNDKNEIHNMVKLTYKEFTHRQLYFMC